MIDFKNKRIIITGASGGIGRCLVEKFVNLNGNVLATGTKMEKLENLKNDFPGINILKFDNLFEKAQKSKKPTLIACSTKIGFGSPNKEGTEKSHGAALGKEEVAKMEEGGTLVAETTGTLRGHSWKHTFVICDEAQNLTQQEVKMLVTRVGFGSKLVLAGDTKQSDLVKEKDGLSHLMAMLKNVTTRLVQTIVFLPGDS
mgnify:CR=1 FL=1